MLSSSVIYHLQHVYNLLKSENKILVELHSKQNNSSEYTSAAPDLARISVSKEGSDCEGKF